jgi:hypothetical protein
MIITGDRRYEGSRFIRRGGGGMCSVGKVVGTIEPQVCQWGQVRGADGTTHYT